MKALIVGNGQSSINPEAQNLSKHRDIFRVNNFFLEPSPLFGKKIKFLSFIGMPYNLYLIDQLRIKKVYDIELAHYREMPKKYFFIPKLINTVIPWKKVVDALSLKNSVSGFDDMNMIDKKQKHAKITSGVYLINCAIQMGYKDISVIGIDFYSEKSLNKYPITIPKCLKDIAIFEGQFVSHRINKKKQNSYDTDLHSYQIDSTYIKNLANTYPDVKLTVYVDDENPYKNWQNISQISSNITVIKLPNASKTSPSISHCLQDIEIALYEYKDMYYWQDKWMRVRHILTYRKSVVKKLYLRILDTLKLN